MITSISSHDKINHHRIRREDEFKYIGTRAIEHVIQEFQEKKQQEDVEAQSQIEDDAVLSQSAHSMKQQNKSHKCHPREPRQ